jgi:AcrR family transcriptional regulator
MVEGSTVNTRQQRRTERTRTQLMDAARVLFVEQGYESVSVGAVTTRADLGAGTYYLHFRDMRAIYEAIVRRELLALRSAWLEKRGASVREGDAVGDISLMVQMVLQSVLHDEGLARLVLLDGPPIEGWLLDDIGREMTAVLKAHVTNPELVSALVIGATLNAARWSLGHPRSVSTKRLVASVVEFCAAGVEETSRSRGGRSRK